MPSALAVFAKRPIPGKVKTRLTPALSPEAAAKFYWAMVEDTWAMASTFHNISLHLFVDEPWEGFDSLAQGRPVKLQKMGDLGSRMYSCFQYITGHNLKSSVIIGTDSPTLPEAHLQAAFSLLEDEDDAVLGPAEDGGYYLVGCRRARPGMFNGVEWSSHQTLTQTRLAFNAHGYRSRLTPLWRDVDSIEDVQRLAKERVGPAVKAWLRQNPI